MGIRTVAFAAVAVLALACSPRRIPGTDIRETDDTRAIYEVVHQYAKAMQAEDAQAVLALVAPDYFDTAGTQDPADDVDAQRLASSLQADFDKVETVKLDITIRDIVVEGDRGYAEIFYDAFYRVQTPEGSIPRHDSDLHRISFRKTEGRWKVVSGL